MNRTTINWKHQLGKWAAYLLGGMYIVTVVLIQPAPIWINFLIALPFVVIVALLPTE